jgi:sulfur carrier protein ThiS/predicted N-acetyltransferase YhbS
MPSVVAEVVGEGEVAVSVAPEATYGDLLSELGFSPHEAAVIVDGDPMPEDRLVGAEVDRVRVLRLVKGGDGGPNGIAVRVATPEDHLDAMRVLDGAALATDAGAVRARLDDGGVLVAVADGSVVGALVLDGDRVTAVAVRRRRRGQGVGTALVEAARRRRGCLVAAFDADVSPFYSSLGFDIERVDDGRFEGTLQPP